MGAKRNAAILLGLALAAPGCAALDLGRFAPPGIVKYEDLEGDKEPSPEIRERIAERKAAGEAKTPRLSEQPQTRPDALPVAERNTLAADLTARRDLLNAAVESDRYAAADERLSAEEAETLAEAAARLEKEIARDKAAADRERRALAREAKKRARKKR